MKALETIIAFGAHRLLTSGQKPTAWEGRELIAGLVRQAGGRIGIMAGAGVTADNAARLVDATGVKEIHAARSVRSADGLVEAELVRSLLKRARKE
jgi:copper homeostasis protein